MRIVDCTQGEGVITITMVWCTGPMRQPFRFLCRWVPFIGAPLVDYLITRVSGLVSDEWIELRPVEGGGAQKTS